MLELRNIQKKFGSQTVLSNVSLNIATGEFFSLLGPSGCGKSTLLRIIAGLETADSGQILWKGKPLEKLPARQRPFNMVFQKYALFPHLTVAKNVAFGLRLQKVPAAEVTARVREALELVNLPGYENRLPETLSGGQSQRVALARAIINRPECILLDEPLSALDQKLREHMQSELRLLQKRLGLTFIFVTHDQEEAMILSDRIAVMNMGHIEQVGSSQELYNSPKSGFSARFVGRRNEFPAITKLQKGHLTTVETQNGSLLYGRWISETKFGEGAKVNAFIRPEQLRICEKKSGASETNFIEGIILEVVFRGFQTEILVECKNHGIIRLPVTDGTNLTPGSHINIEFTAVDTHIFPADS